MVFWLFILRAILTGIIGSSFYAWFKTTKMGIWVDAKLDSIMSRVVNRHDIAVLKKQEKQLEKLPPDIVAQLNAISDCLQDLTERLEKIEAERELEKDVWYRVRSNNPRTLQ
jgi:mRNA-degrading endonuclease RelE of RelBE toxin-antitoxin system